MTRARATRAAVTVAAVLVATRGARADTVYKGAIHPIPLPNVKVTGVAGGTLTYTTVSGEARTIALTDVPQIAVDGQAGFNGAEAAYAGRDFPTALSGYQSALDGGGVPDWIRVRSARRLAAVARAVTPPRYDVQVSAYVALLGSDPASAAAVRPAAPRTNDPTLDAARTVAARAVGSATGPAKSALLSVQLDINRARGDTAGVTQTLQQLVATGGATPDQQAMLKLAAADVALDAKQYAQAESAVQQNRGLFTDPAQQVDALFVLAQARDGLLPATPGPDALKDVALAYLRVATFGGELADHPHVAESTLRAAQLEERLNDPAAAGSLYQQLTAPTYAATAAGAEARAAVGRLKK